MRPAVARGQNDRIAIGINTICHGQHGVEALNCLYVLPQGALVVGGECFCLAPQFSRLRAAARREIGCAVGEDGGKTPETPIEAISRDIAQRDYQRHPAGFLPDIVVPADLAVTVVDQLRLQFSVYMVELDGKLQRFPAIQGRATRDADHRRRTRQMVPGNRDSLGEVVFGQVRGDRCDGWRVGRVPLLQVTESERLVFIPPLPLGLGNRGFRQAFPGVGKFRSAVREIGAQFDDFLLVQDLALFEDLNSSFQMVAAMENPAIDPTDKQFPDASDFKDQANNFEYLATEGQVPPVLDDWWQPIDTGDTRHEIGDCVKHGSPPDRSFRAGVRLTESCYGSKLRPVFGAGDGGKG